MWEARLGGQGCPAAAPGACGVRGGRLQTTSLGQPTSPDPGAEAAGPRLCSPCRPGHRAPCSQATWHVYISLGGAPNPQQPRLRKSLWPGFPRELLGDCVSFVSRGGRLCCGLRGASDHLLCSPTAPLLGGGLAEPSALSPGKQVPAGRRQCRWGVPCPARCPASSRRVLAPEGPQQAHPLPQSHDPSRGPGVIRRPTQSRAAASRCLPPGTLS